MKIIKTILKLLGGVIVFLIIGIFVVYPPDNHPPDGSSSRYLKESDSTHNDKVAGLELFPIARNGVDLGELVIKVGFSRSDFDQPVFIFDFPRYVWNFTHGEEPVVSFQFDEAFRSDITFNYYSRESYEFYKDCNFYGHRSYNEDNCDEYIELVRQLQDKDQLVVTIENASTMTYDLAEASENINALIHFMDSKNEDSDSPSMLE